MQSQRRWKAKWIWVKDRPVTEPNIYARFRKTFDLQEVPINAIADISADSRYMLYANGSFICRGVPMCDPLYQYYDSVDIAPYLRKGRNAIAVLVHHYGVSTSKYMSSGRAGFLFEAKIGNDVIKSDSSWKACIEEAYNQNVPRICATHLIQGFQEHFDARKSPDNWKDPNFDDSKWPEAIIVDWLGRTDLPIDPWPSLVPRDIPHYLEEERPASSIYRIGEVADAPLGEDNDLSAKMQAEPMQNSDFTFIENANAMISWDESFAFIKPNPQNSNACPSVIIDFGKEVTGMPRIDLEGPEGAIVDIALAELPTKNGINHYWGNLIGMGVAHRYIMRKGRQTFETFARYGFRYAQLTFRNFNSPIKVHRASINFSSYAVKERGRFNCSDSLLNEIWKTGAYTAQCCMYDGWEDCPGREQRQWVGDARVEALIAYAAFGDFALTRKFLVQIGQSQRPDGMTMSLYPGCCGITNSTIQDYNLHWISAIYEYYLYSGDDNIVKELYPKVILSMRWWEKYINENGLLENIPSHIFLDTTMHCLSRTVGVVTILNCFYIDALRAASKMARMNKDSENMRKWRDLAERVAIGINNILFDENEGIYADTFYEGKLGDLRSQHSNLLPLLYDIVPSHRLPSVWKFITDESQLCRNKDDEKAGRKITATQPFFTYFLFEMLAKRGRTDIILELTRRLWKPMIDAGHGTFWETWYDVRDEVEKGTQTSMCHAWAATPTYHLSSDILGVRPTSPGFSTFDIRPRPHDIGFANGIFPSVRGDIEVNWKNSRERFEIEFTVPCESIARIILPIAQPSKVILDGNETQAYAMLNGSIEFTQILPGRHIIEAVR